MAWDVTVPETLAPSHVQATAASAGSAASSSEALKSAKYADLATTHTFIPLALRDVGFLGRVRSSLCGRARAAHFGGHRGQSRDGLPEAAHLRRHPAGKCADVRGDSRPLAGFAPSFELGADLFAMTLDS